MYKNTDLKVKELENIFLRCRHRKLFLRMKISTFVPESVILVDGVKYCDLYEREGNFAEVNILEVNEKTV